MASSKQLELAPRLRSLDGAPVAFVFNGKEGCEGLVRAVAAQLIEARGLPVAWLDTASRVPHVRRTNGRFLIEYAANHRIEAHASRGGKADEASQEKLKARFEKFGFHRALRLAGAAPGDIVEVGSLTIELWDYSEASYPHIPDGMSEYPYVEVSPVARMSQTDLRYEVERVTPMVRRRLGRPASGAAWACGRETRTSHDGRS